MRRATFVFDITNYDGIQFAAALTTKLKTAVIGFAPLLVFNSNYAHLENILVVNMTDARAGAVINLTPIKFNFLTDDTLTNDSPRVSDPNAITTIIRNTVETGTHRPSQLLFNFVSKPEFAVNLFGSC